MRTLAIVIPYYKIDFFEETLQSVAAQTDKCFTLYIGNDASPDDPLPLIQKYFPDGNFHYYNYKENLGGKNLAMQWERILENVTEEWFQILGDDDMISENFVEEFYAQEDIITHHECNVVKYSQRWINDEGIPIRDFIQHERIITPIENWKRKFINGEHSSLSEYIFKKSSYDLFGFKKFPLAWHTDDIAVLEFADHKPICFIDHANISIRVSDASISGSSHQNHIKKEASREFYAYLLNHYAEKLPIDFVHKTIKQEIVHAKKNKKLSLNLVSIYWRTKNYKKLLLLPKTYLALKFKS